MDKLHKSNKVLINFLEHPSRNQKAANQFLSSVVKELNNIISIKNPQIEKSFSEELDDISKLPDYQKWLIVEESIKEKLKYYETFKNPIEHIHHLEKELLSAQKKIDILLGKKRKRSESCFQDNEEQEENKKVVESDIEVDNEEEESFNMDDLDKFNEEMEENEQNDEKENSDDNEEFDVEDSNDQEEDFTKVRKALAKKKEKKVNDREVEDEVFAKEHGYYENNQMIDKIENLENKMVGEKDWQMKGEVSAKQRPVGSLLENNLDFKVTKRPPPIPTAEWSNKIELIIKTRISSDLFDDPKRSVMKEKKQISEVDLIFEKSSKGLAELYEEDWYKQNEQLKEVKSHDKIEIEELMENLFFMFTKITNNTFIGERVKNEMNLIKDVASIEVKDVSKTVINDKVLKNDFDKTVKDFNPKRTETVTKDELTVEENKKKHRQIKRKVHKKLYEKANHKKLNSLMKEYDSKFEAKLAMNKEKDKKDKANIKSKDLKSANFFSNLGKEKPVVEEKANSKNIKNYKL